MKDITKKLYINEGRDYIEVRRRRDKVEVQGREIPLSEHDRPYLVNDEDDDTYQSYEEDFVIQPPDWPPNPDPAPGPCSAEDGCGYVKIFRDYPNSMECGSTYWFRTVHETHGCAPPSGAAGIVGWTASAGEILSQTVGMRWRAPECCHEDKVTITAFVVPDCHDAIEITLQCECCENFEIEGPETVNPNNTWTGSLDPPCPGARVYVSSNSECAASVSGELNEDGDEITVSIGAVACGSVDITIQDQNEGCETPKAYHSIRVNQGSNGGQCVAGWEEVHPRPFPLHGGEFTPWYNYFTGWCPGAIYEWLGYCPPLCGWCRVRGPWGSCADCTDGRYKYDVMAMCCCGFDWDGGTEWEQDTYRYSIRPCGMGEALPCGCSAAALCPVGYWCDYDGKYTTGEAMWGVQIEEWIGKCA